MAGQVAQSSVLVQATGQINPVDISQISVLVAVSAGSVVVTPPPPTYGYYRPPEPPIPNSCDLKLWSIRRFMRTLSWPEGLDTSLMPTNAVEFHERAGVVTPAPGAGDVLVMDWTVPSTYDGIIYGVCLQYSGTGFEDGSGDIYWRVRVGNSWVRNMGNVSTALGEVYQFLQITDKIDIHSNDRIQIYTNVPNLSGNIQVGTSRILVGVQGWLYPVVAPTTRIKCHY